MDSIRKHLLLLPGPFFGHYIPQLEFARKAIEYHDVTIAVARSKLNGIRDRNLLPQKPIKIVSYEDNLTLDLDKDFTLPSLGKVSRHLKPILNKVIAEIPLQEPSGDAGGTLDHSIRKVDVVFWDFFFNSVVTACHKRGIPNYAVSSMPTSYMNCIWRINEETETFPDEEMINGATVPEGKTAETFKDIFLEETRNMDKCDGVIFNSFEEIDLGWGEVFKHIAETFHIPVYFVGPLLPEDEPDRTAYKLNKWLDAQQEKSVVYFSFGTIGKTCVEQLEEIGKALLSLKKPFIWSLRNFQEKELPKSFELSTLNDIDLSAPYLIVPWVPQKEILPHPSLAVFVSHCGWNSVLEAAHFGVPIAAWGFFADQPGNALLVEKLGLGLRVGDTGLFTDNVIEAERIAKVIEGVAGWDQGEAGGSKYWNAAKEMQKKALAAVSSDGKSFQSLKLLLQNLQSQTVLFMLTSLHAE